ncbi:MAG TPA: beta-propeller domain-containing protein [Myxococcota bacterium]|nr:beta-propeller domain-containing protein [Myxococcota bacterium]
MKRFKFGLLMFTPVLAFVLLGCGDDNPNSPGDDPEAPSQALSLDWTKAAALTAAADCEQAEEWIEEAFIKEMILGVEHNRRCALDYGTCGLASTDMAGAEPPSEEGAEKGTGSEDKDTPEDYSETNVQVEGVDEADKVKTDGKHIYVLSENDLVVLKSWPAAETQELGRIRLDGYPNNFFLKGDKAIVLAYAELHEVVDDVPVIDYKDDGTSIPGAEDPGASDGGAAPKEPSDAGDDRAYYYYDYRPVTVVTVIDLSDKTNLKVEKTYIFDGSEMDSRRIDDKVYLALNRYINMYLSYWPEDLLGPYYNRDNWPTSDVINAAFDQLIERNTELIKAKTLADWLPMGWVAQGGEKASFNDGQSLGSCEDLYAPSVFSGQGLLSLATLDVETGKVAASTIQGEWGNVYASHEAVYVASTNWGFYWWWDGQEDFPAIQTHIHKFAFNKSGFANYAASGKVLGYAINQFAFDEYEGKLRVATTDDKGWWNNDKSESRVTVLEEKGGELAEIGVVAGLGLGERIYGVRFIGDQGYVVTYKEIDPLYVIDLKDPTNPTVAGELKIPGFSSYIHPLEDGFLLTAGRDGDDLGNVGVCPVGYCVERQDGDDLGNVGGVKIEIFDVTDPANPRSVTKAVIGDGWNTWSDVLWDHKAFNFFRARNLLAIPVSGWVDSDDFWGYKSELALFKVTKDEIETLPTISHMNFFEDFGGNDRCHGYYGYWRAQIYRSVFVEDYVYSLSTLGMQVHDTRDFEQGSVAELILLDQESFPRYDWETCYDYY